MIWLLHVASHTISIALAGSLALFGLAWFFQDPLADVGEILPELNREPRQEMIRAEEFVFTYRGDEYLVQPVADYELTGLIVTHNDINAFADIYHDEDSVDVRDVCVVWGVNTKNGVFQRMRYWSEPWSCWFQAPDRETDRAFSPGHLSNNHLLPGSEAVRKAILSAKIGDQVRFQGQLINYAPRSHPNYMRKTSTNRDDGGNGACEIVLVDDFEILKPVRSLWRNLYETTYAVLPWLLVAKVLAFILVPYLELGAREVHLKQRKKRRRFAGSR